MDDPNIAAKAQLSPSQREEVNARLLRCMSLWGQRGLGQLLDEGGDVDSVYPRGEGPMESPIWGLTVGMQAACKLGHASQNREAFPAMRRILQLCDPDSRDLQGLTPLMHAAAEQSLEAVEILAPRSDLLAVCDDMGADFDAGWPALFFAVNTKVGPDGVERQKRLCELLVHPKIWSMRSREGLDVFDCAQRCGPSPEILDVLGHLRGLHQAQEQAGALRQASRPAKAAPKKTL